MARDNDRISLNLRSDTAIDADATVRYFTLDRPMLVTAVSVIPVNPADADGDTVAFDVSYSTDGFSSSDVEVAAKAAVEFNDTDNNLGTLLVPLDVPLTTASLASGSSTVRVPADAAIRLTTTWTGAPADGVAELVVIGHTV